MRKKNIITIMISAVAFIVAVALLYRYLAPPTRGSGVQVVVPAPVNPSFNQEQLNVLQADVVDYTVSINVSALINNVTRQKANSPANTSGGN